MTELAVVLALGLAVWALVRASRLERRLDEVRAELARLQGGERVGVTGVPLPTAESLSPPPETPPVWPEDVPVVAEPVPIKPRGPSLWDPEYSRARISVVGGVLVLGGLAFTLRELGAPSWTGLLAVFAFGGLLFLNARRVPWPVSGALRGLGYGVTALGLGSVTQRLPDAWGPAVVMAGLLALSAGLLWDGLRRREPLLGALAVLGAGLSVWMLTDDLGRGSVLAAGAVLLLAGVAVSGRATGQREAETAGTPEGTNRTALALTLGAAGLVPLGWLVASVSHSNLDLLFDGEGAYAPEVLALGGSGVVPGLLVWLVFAALALVPALALLTRREEEDTRAPVPALAAWATLGPQVLVAAAVGTALAERGRVDPVVDVLALVLLALLGLVARHAWGRRLSDGEEHSLTGTLAGSLTAAASGVAGAAVLGLLGARTQPAAIAGVALALLLVGLSARSRGWLTTGAVGLGLSALWGASLAGTEAGETGRNTLGGALLGALPAAVALVGAWRVARDPWATLPRPTSAPDGTPGVPTPRLTAPLLAGAGGLLAVAALQTGGDELLWVAVAMFSAGLWGLQSVWQRTDPNPLRRAALWALAPGAAVGALMLVGTADGSGWDALASSLMALVAAGSLLGTARRAGGEVRAVAEGAGLLVLALTLGRVALTWLPEVGVPGALALTAALTVPLRLVWGWSRLDVGLGLGLLTALLALLLAPLDDLSPVPALGVLLLGLVWALTRTAGGLRTLGGLPAEDAAPQRPHVQALWLAALLLVGLLSLGARLDPAATAEWPWLALSSLAVLGVGLGACVRARRTGDPPRLLWDTGLGLIVAAGLKGVFLDAPEVPNTGAAVGVAVLVTGLSLLAVAILAPRPPGPAAVVGRADQAEG